MRNRAVRRAERFIGVIVLAGVSSVAGAQETQTQTSVLVSTGASVETNPYNELNSGGASVAATAEIRPLLRWRGERSTIDLSGLASFRQFVNRYGLEDNYGANGNISTRVNERLTVFSSGGFSYSQGGFNDFGRAGLPLGVPTLPGTIPGVDPNLPVPGVVDAAVLGQRIRTTAFDMGLGANTQLGAYSNLSLNLSGRGVRFGDAQNGQTGIGQAGFGDFNSINGQVSYTHQLSEATSVGVTGGLSRSDYLGTRVGDARTTSISGTIDRRIGARWTLWGSAGIAMTRIDQLPGMPDDKFDAFTAQIRFCNQGERGRFCLAGNRSPEPSANGSVRLNNTVQADYSYRLSERETATVSGSYARTGRGRGNVPALLQPAVDFVSGAVRYDNQIRDNLTFYATTNFSKIYTSDVSRNANFGVSAGVQFRFGAFQ